ncbi:MAG: ABC transporter permease [Burkholderiaceae bacterium]
MESAQVPTIVIRSAPAGVSAGASVRLTGCWTAAAVSDPRLQRNLRPSLRRAAALADGDWDLTAAERFDHVAAQLLLHALGGRIPDRLQATDGQRATLERVASLTIMDAPTPRPPLRERLVERVVAPLGRVVNGGLTHAAGLVRVLGQTLLDLIRLVARPAAGPWRDCSAHLFRMGAQALPITALVGFLIGVVVAYLLALQLRQFGADAFIVNILGLSLIRELGPLLAAILVAGRSGSAIAAQIGVMRVNEELDAMRVMGIAHGFRLVMPRALALGLAMPLVSLWTTLAALIGGMWAADVSLGLSPAYFLQALPAAVDVVNLWIATAKSVVFGVVIALIGCHWGLWIKPDTESLGVGTTASVVSSITSVILIDAVFAIVFRKTGF